MTDAGTAPGHAPARPNQREHILDVALRLMSERGAVGMSMRQLAAACGVQVAAIYHYFASKDALLAAVVAERQYGTRLSDPLPVDPDDPPAQRLRTLVHFVWEGALAEQAVWRLVLGEGMRGEPTVMPVGRDLLELLEPASEAWVREVLPEVDRPESVAALLVGQLLSGFVRLVFRPDDDPSTIAEESADALVAVVLAR
jgi:AcrR family transcriptional regulator